MKAHSIPRKPKPKTIAVRRFWHEGCSVNKLHQIANDRHHGQECDSAEVCEVGLMHFINTLQVSLDLCDNIAQSKKCVEFDCSTMFNVELDLDCEQKYHHQLWKWTQLWISIESVQSWRIYARLLNSPQFISNSCRFDKAFLIIKFILLNMMWHGTKLTETVWWQRSWRDWKFTYWSPAWIKSISGTFSQIDERQDHWNNIWSGCMSRVAGCKSLIIQCKTDLMVLCKATMRWSNRHQRRCTIIPWSAIMLEDFVSNGFDIDTSG